MKLFTLGYQSLDVPGYVETLAEAGVGLVADVRDVPWSRKPGFSKSPLAAALAAAGIDYLHVREAGNPASVRKSGAADVLALYREYLTENDAGVVALLPVVAAAWAAGRPACLTCFERDPGACHRSILASALAERVPALEIVHLPLATAPSLFG